MSSTIEILDATSAVTVSVAVATPGPGPKGDPAAGAYISAIDTTSYALSSLTQAQQVQIGTSLEGDDITLVNDAIVFGTAGVYSITWSAQMTNTNGSAHWLEIWHRLNGEDIANSGSRFDVPPAKSGVPGHLIGTVNFVLTVSADDALTLWMAGEDLELALTTFLAGTSPTRPAVPSMIISAVQIR